MEFVDMLVEAGFGSAAKGLSEDEHFRRGYHNKTAAEMLSRIKDISLVYSISNQDTIRLIASFPHFADYDHRRVVKDIKEVYGFTDSQISKTVLSNPQFVSLDHRRVVKDIKEVYGFTDSQISKSVLSFPPFTNLDHRRVVKDIKEVYGFTDSQISKTVSSHPSFAGYNHRRVMRNLRRIGNSVGLDMETIKAGIYAMPSIAGYSTQRHLAVIDVFRHLGNEVGGLSAADLANMWVKRAFKSPYVPGTDRLRISQALRRGEYNEEPKLMTIIRKDLGRMKTRSVA